MRGADIAERGWRPAAVRGQRDPEAAAGQAEQHGAGTQQVGDPRGAEFLQDGDLAGQLVPALPARLAERHRVGPDLGPRLAQELPGGGAVQRLQQVVPPGGRWLQPAQLIVLGAHSGR